MALLQEIQVPLLAVNDTSLTVVEMAFPSGHAVKKGELIMVFETSKTTYDVEAEAEGYVQYLCQLDQDYEVNAVVARIYSEAAEAAAGPVLRPVVVAAAGEVKATAPVAGPARAALPPGRFSHRPVQDWQGETVFSEEALRLIGSSGIDRSLFAGMDLVGKADVLAILEPGSTASSGSSAVPAVGTDTATAGLPGPAKHPASPRPGRQRRRRSGLLSRWISTR